MIKENEKLRKGAECLPSYQGAGVGEYFRWLMFDSDGESYYLKGKRIENKHDFESSGKNKWIKSEKCLIIKDGSTLNCVMNSCMFLAPSGELCAVPLILEGLTPCEDKQ